MGEFFRLTERALRNRAMSWVKIVGVMAIS